MIIGILLGIIRAIPYTVTLGHFIPSWAALIIYLVLTYYVMNISDACAIIVGIINIIVILMGYYFAFVEFPLWFFILYIALCTPALIKMLLCFVRK